MSRSQLVNGPSPSTTDEAPMTAARSHVIIPGKTGRILCVADIRGDYHELNRLIREHEASAVIHVGDFGFMSRDSLNRIGDKILRHVIKYSPLIPPMARKQLLDIPESAGRETLIRTLDESSVHFPLSQFPLLLSGSITFPVPVFAVWGLIEDVFIMEKFRTQEYEIQNLHLIDDVSTRLLQVGGMKLRLFGLGGAVANHKLFDFGEGHATIAGGSGTMWSTVMQLAELLETGQRTFDPTEIRLMVTSAPISRHGILTQIAMATRADFTISGGLHFRYPASFNDFGVHPTFEAFINKLIYARDQVLGVYESVKGKVDDAMSDEQKARVHKLFSLLQTMPSEEDSAWTDMWHWVLSDASCGHMVLSITDSRVSAETKSHGLNFGHRAADIPAPPSAHFAAPVQVAKPPIRTVETSVQPPGSRVPHVTPSRPVNGPPNPNIPAKPPAANQAPPQVAGFRSTMPSRPPPSTPVRPIAAGHVKPVPSTNTTDAALAAGIPASNASQPSNNLATASKPMAPTRQPRGPTGMVTKALNAVGLGGAAEKITGQKDRSANTANKAAAGSGDKAVPKDAKKMETKANGSVAETFEASKTSETKVDAFKSPEPRALPKRWELYLKGIPTNVKDDDLKSSFGDFAGKITKIKIPMDPVRQNQKDFAYIGFDSENDMQEAMAAHPQVKLGEVEVNVQVSNPPARYPNDGSRGRGRGSFSRGTPRGRGGFLSRGGREGEPNGNGAGKEDKVEKKDTSLAAPISTSTTA